MTPGLGGSNQKLQFGPGDIFAPPNNCQGCPGGDHSIASNTSVAGSTVWFEFFLYYEPGYKWICGANCGTKTIDLLMAGSGAAYGRYLFNTERDGDDDHAHPYLSLYPNYGVGGTDAGAQTNRWTEKAPNVSNFRMTSGVTYHVVMEFLLGQGTSGAYKIWVNDVMTHHFSGLQTIEAPEIHWSAVGIGGPAWVVVDSGGAPLPGAHTWSQGPIRLTTTNLAPGSSAAPGR